MAEIAIPLKMELTSEPATNEKTLTEKKIKEIIHKTRSEELVISLCGLKLHSDAITEDESDKEKVVILMYDGVSPSRYLQLFKMYHNNRKDNTGTGEPIEADLKKARPKVMLSLEAIPVLELMVSDELGKKGLKIT